MRNPCPRTLNGTMEELMTIEAGLSPAKFCDPNLPVKKAKSSFSSAWIAAMFLFWSGLVFAAQPLMAQYLELYDFANAPGGSYPSLMAEGRDGNLYGVTAAGGTASKGLIFKIGPAGNLSTVYSFDGTHGSTPVGGLTLGPDGNLYGMAEQGGANGEGNIFKVTPAGVLTVLYDFKGSGDGGLPVSALIFGGDGYFYGTSYPGYAFKISPAGVFHVIAKIPGTSNGPLVRAANGSFYGVTEFGGTHSAGTIYRITGSTVTTIHSFAGPDGSYPVGGLVEASDGNLYGTTTAGGSSTGGLIYRITPSGAFSVVYDFDSVHTSAGYESYAGLVAGEDGNLYGVTIWGGLNGYGVIFEMTTGGVYSVLYSFDAPHGDGAYATPMQHTNGKIYGMTTRGGLDGKGVVYGYGRGLAPFVELVTNWGVVGNNVGVVGHGFAQASGVSFNGTPASFHVVSDSFLTAAVPSGETGFVTVNTASGAIISNRVFYVTPQVTGFSPTSGKAGDTITITGAGLIQASRITVGGASVLAYTVNSDSKLTFTVPASAVTGKIVVATPGGKAASADTFTVTP